MRKVFVAQSVVAAALATFGYSATSSPVTAASFRAPLPKVEGAIVPVNHRRYWRQDYYYPYYPYPAYAPYYYGPPPVAYAPPVIYYPGPRYYPGPAVYGPRFYVGRPYGAYYADW
jgi:hypothetical protein